ncbi:zinc transporter ZIP2-like [Rhodnius prolixus]
MALSIHQIFEGLAVGLESDTGKVWVLLSAIAAHKLIIAICVGAEMASSRTDTCTTTICVAAFAVASPIGIAIGIGLSSNSSANDLAMNTTSVVLQGLATGTLLYVVFFEVLKRSERSKSGFVEYAATLIGFIIMIILLYFYHD